MEQRTSEWHKFRKKHIGASDAPVIMGVSPWKDVKRLYNEKTTEQEQYDISNFAIRRGIALEPKALEIFEAETGYLMSPKVINHPSIDFMSASLDGMEIEGEAILEIKCPGIKDHSIALDNAVPEKYIPQIQHQMEVAGLNKIYYMSFVSEVDYKILEICKDNEYVDELLKKEKEFWECVIKREPPKFTGKDIEEIENEEWKELAEKWKKLQSNKESIEFEEEFLRKQMLQMANYKESYGAGIEIKKIIRRGHVDYSRIPELKQINIENYRKPSVETWRIINI